MEDKEKEITVEEGALLKEEKPKNMWQIEKENWYDKIPLTLAQLDKIVVACWILLVLAFIVIALDAMDIFNPFGS